jgi:broad specificity phosphatase PhoE
LHKGVIKIVIAQLLGLAFEDYHAMPVDLGSIHRLTGQPGAWTLGVRNDTAHLHAT